MSKEITNERDLEKIMERAVSRVLPNILKQQVNNIRTATVINVSATGRTIDARVNGTGDILTGIKYQSGASTPNPGDQVMLISPDPSLKNQVKAIVF